MFAVMAHFARLHNSSLCKGRWKLNVRAALILGMTVITVAACGGGGGSTVEQPGTGTTTPVDPTSPTFRFTERYPEPRFSEMAIEALDNGDRLLTYAQFGTDIAHRFAGPNSPASTTANCAFAGRISLQFNDRDGDRRASAGDSITAVLENCGVPALLRSVSGTLRIDIVAATPSVDVGLQARFTIVDELKIGSLGGANYLTFQPGTLRGSLSIQWAESSTGAQLRATSSAEDDLRYTAIYDGIESTDTLRRIDVSQTVRYDSATVDSSMAFLFDVGTRGGMLRVRTAQPFHGDLSKLPKRFQVDAEIAGGRVLRIARDPSPNSALNVSATLIEANSTVSASSPKSWGQHLSLIRDVRQNTGFSASSDQGEGHIVILPRRNRDGMAWQAFCWDVGAGVNHCRPDALFQRPVFVRPELTEPGAVLKVQFGRAIADNTPELQFRLADTAQVIDAGSPPWAVSATAVRRGAYYEIRPTEPLRQGRTYSLQASRDGIDWSAEHIIRDAQNQVVYQGASSLAVIHTDNALVAATAMSDLATVSAVSPARLRGQANLRDGQSVSSYRWEQVSGPTLRLVTPQASETDAVLDGNGPHPLGDAVVQLTITDSLGNTDRARVAMKVGNIVTRGAAFYSHMEAGASSRSLETGAGSMFYGPEPGRVSPRIPGASEWGTGASFSVTPANGQKLAVGTYQDAILSAAPGARNGLISRVFCYTEGAPVRGSFDVLDVAYGADDTIVRLAIDFVQSCEAGLGEFQRGSYRFNSSVPIKP